MCHCKIFKQRVREVRAVHRVCTILYDCVALGENVFLFDYNNMLSLALLIM